MSDSPTSANPGGLPYAGGDDEDLGGDRPWYQKPGTLIGVIVLVALAVLAVVLLSGGDDKAEPDTTTSTTTSTTAPTTTTTSTTSTTSTTTTTAPPPTGEPGLPCSPEEGSPDCIDPEGDGTYVYLINGAECIGANADPATCIDSNNDGVAGAGGAGD